MQMRQWECVHHCHDDWQRLLAVISHRVSVCLPRVLSCISGAPVSNDANGAGHQATICPHPRVTPPISNLS